MFDFVKHQTAVPVVNLENMETMLDRLLQTHLAIYDKPVSERSKLERMVSYWTEVHRICKKKVKRDENVSFKLPTHDIAVGVQHDALNLIMFLNVDLAEVFSGKILMKLDRKLNDLKDDI